jgi:hypothetical protein
MKNLLFFKGKSGNEVFIQKMPKLSKAKEAKKQKKQKIKISDQEECALCKKMCRLYVATQFCRSCYYILDNLLCCPKCLIKHRIRYCNPCCYHTEKSCFCVKHTDEISERKISIEYIIEKMNKKPTESDLKDPTYCWLDD